MFYSLWGFDHFCFSVVGLFYASRSSPGRIEPGSELKPLFKLESRVRESSGFDKSVLKFPFLTVPIVDDVVEK